MQETLTALVDSNKLFREGLKSLLSDTQFKVGFEASAIGDFGQGSASEEKPELILVDLPSDPENRFEDLERLRAMLPDARIVVLTSELCSERLASCFAAGIDGYLLKDISCDALLESLRLVLLGEKVFPTYLATLIVNNAGQTSLPPRRKLEGHKLSEREIEILQCLVEGNSNKVIANRLRITEATVKVHLKSILRKIDVSNRTQAAIWALNQGFSSGTQEGIGAGSVQ